MNCLKIWEIVMTTSGSNKSASLCNGSWSLWHSATTEGRNKTCRTMSHLQRDELKAWMQHSQLNFKLKARVNRSDARTVRQALGQLSAKGSVTKEGDEFVLEARWCLHSSGHELVAV